MRQGEKNLVNQEFKNALYLVNKYTFYGIFFTKMEVLLGIYGIPHKNLLICYVLLSEL